jgi:hypothetical protein
LNRAVDGRLRGRVGWPPPAVWLAQSLLLFASPELAAQAPAPGPPGEDTVASRRRPELEALGVSVGSLLVNPSFGFSSQLDDNVYATEADQKEDLTYVLSPAVTVRSRGSQNAFRFFGGLDLGRFQKYTSENYDDWRVSADGRLGATGASRLLLGGTYASLHEPRESPDNAGGLVPTRYSSTTGFADFSHRPGRLFVHASATFNRLVYDDVPALVGGQLVELEQGDRDRNEYGATLETGLGRGPEDGAFVRVRGVLRDYDRVQQLTGFDRSSQGFEAGVGLVLGSAGVTRARAYVGYRQQLYLDPLPDIREPVFEVSLGWNPSRLTSVRFESGRDVLETTGAVYSGYVDTSARFVIDHELRRNLLFNVALVYYHDAYVGIGRVSRTDKSWSAGGGMTWLLNRHFAMSLRYESSGRNSTDRGLPPGFPSDAYARSTAFVRVELRE